MGFDGAQRRWGAEGDLVEILRSKTNPSFSAILAKPLLGAAFFMVSFRDSESPPPELPRLARYRCPYVRCR